MTHHTGVYQYCADAFDLNKKDVSILKDIISEVQEIENVGDIFYNVTTKPPGTIECE